MFETFITVGSWNNKSFNVNEHYVTHKKQITHAIDTIRIRKTATTYC